MILVCEFKTGLNYITVVYVDNSYIVDVSGILTLEMYIIVYIYIVNYIQNKDKTIHRILCRSQFTYVYSFYTYIYYLSVYLLFKSEFIQFNLNLDIIVYTLHFLIDIFIKYT